MVSFRYPPGLVLLLAIPLLLFFVRSRSLPRRELLTAFFLLERVRKPAVTKTIRFFRLRRRHRLGLVALVIAGLALAIAGTEAGYERDAAERWLLVVDNTPLGLRSFDGTTVHERIRGFLAGRSGTFPKRDQVSVLLTSPAPSLETFRPGGDLDAYLRAIPVAGRFPPVAQAAAVVAELSRQGNRPVVLSPRAELWRAEAGRPGRAGAFAVPPDQRTARGNTGFAGGGIRPNGGQPDAHDVFLRVAAADGGAASVPFSASHEGRDLGLAGTVEIAGGRGSVFLEGVTLPAGRTVFSLGVEDAFPPDDTIALTVEEPGPVLVSLTGDSTPVFEAALSSFPPFRIAEPGGSDVSVFLGDFPPVLDRPSLIVFPARTAGGLAVEEIADTQGDIRWHPDHPITVGLPPGSISPRRVARISFGGGFESLATVDGIPALLAGELDGRRVVVWAFNPLEDDVFLAPEFVILLRESVQWLAGAETDGEPFLGETLTREAGQVSLPEMTAGLFEPRRRERHVVDLVPLFAALALLAGLYLGLVDALGGEVRE